MAYRYTSNQVDRLRELRDAGDYAGAYREAARMASDDQGSPIYEADKWVIQWLRGAADVNEGVGPFSTLIRTFTSTQHEIRHGSSLSGETLSQISNKIAEKVIQDIITSPNWELPNLEIIGNRDASVVVSEEFNDDYGAWSGNILFAGLGDLEPLRKNILNDDGDTYDLFAAVKSLNVAVPSAGIVDLFVSAWSQYSVDYGSVLTAADDVTAYLQRWYGSAGSLLVDFTGNLDVGRQREATTLAATSERDVLIGGEANDLFLASAVSQSQNDPDLFDGGKGVDTADFSALSSGQNFVVGAIFPGEAPLIWAGENDPRVALYNIEKLEGTDSNDEFNFLSGKISLESINGRGGQDTIDFSLSGLNGVSADLLTGRISTEVKDYIIDGIERFVGTSGDDTLVGSADLTFFDGRSGSDAVNLLDSTGAVSGLELKSVESIRLSSFDDSIKADGADVFVEGGLGKDLIQTGSGNDVLYGFRFGVYQADDAEKDKLQGGDGNDTYLLNSVDQDFVHNVIIGDGSEGFAMQTAFDFSIFSQADEIYDADGSGIISYAGFYYEWYNNGQEQIRVAGMPTNSLLLDAYEHELDGVSLDYGIGSKVYEFVPTWDPLVQYDMNGDYHEYEVLGTVHQGDLYIWEEYLDWTDLSVDSRAVGIVKEFTSGDLGITLTSV